MKIKFCGAAESVTGSCHLISGEGFKILLDCGQFQGSKAQEAMNYSDFPFNPADIDFVVLSHAHIDHCGRIPLLVKRGFRGKIYCTDATADLVQVMLRDSGYIHEKEAEWKNRKAERAGRPFVEPLYTVSDAEYSLRYLAPVMYDQLVEANGKVKLVFNDAGHILGSAICEIWAEEGGKVTKLVFTGDIGAADRPILRNPKQIKKADYVIMESTYGDRAHGPNAAAITRLKDIVLNTARRGGTVVIPSFAVGRTQELIFEFNRLYESGTAVRHELDNIIFYVDSPMATAATDIFRRNAQVFDEETKNYILEGDNPLDFRNLRFTRTSEESRALNSDGRPKVIISASGMCDAGRIRHHLKHHLWNKNSSIVFVGYQARGTLGRALLDGIESVSLFGEEIQVNAEIHNLEGFSGHADRDGLLDWVSGLRQAPAQIFLVHGEQQAKEALAASIRLAFGYEAHVVTEMSEFDMDKGEVMTRAELMESFAGREQLESMRRKLADVHGRLERILYNTHLAFSDGLPPERVLQISDAVAALERDTINLGSAVTSENMATAGQP
ncbi:MAG: MBL fold metallo-hydrolase [Clostridiales Family XIII bacterium]|jgi:metallo-beta-lactamase family protein|nr:MBL fold metallo-hydrolase [Clostridiales Family XIII bacterium]